MGNAEHVKMISDRLKPLLLYENDLINIIRLIDFWQAPARQSYLLLNRIDKMRKMLLVLCEMSREGGIDWHNPHPGLSAE